MTATVKDEPYDARGSADASRLDATDPDTELRARIRRELHAIRPGKLPERWSDDASFREDLELDSLDFIEMVARLEQATGVFVPDDDMGRLTSVTSTVAYVRQRASAAGGG